MPEPLFIARGERDIHLLPQMANRHGMIAGATGTGKTVSLQSLAQALSRIGVPIFMADVKGDLAGISQPGSAANAKVAERVAQLGLTDFTFTVTKADFKKALALTKETAKGIEAKDVAADENISKVSIVGVGMRSHAGVATKMFETLAKEGINIQMISTSEIKVSVVIDAKYTELAVRVLHDAFGMSEKDVIAE